MRGSNNSAVLGPSAAGLQATREPSDFYGTVIPEERHKPPMDAQGRHGARPGQYVHRILCASTGTIEQLIPGFVADFVVSGIAALDKDSTRASFSGHELPRTAKFSDPRSALWFTAIRPSLEAAVRQRDRDILDVTVTDHHVVVELIAASLSV